MTSALPSSVASSAERKAGLMEEFKAEVNETTLEISRDLTAEAASLSSNHLVRVEHKRIEALETKNMELKLELYNLRKKMKQDAEEMQRRMSVKEGGGFYDFDDGRRGSADSRRGSTMADFTVQAQLQEKLAELEVKYTQLEVHFNRERRAAEGLAARAERDRGTAEKYRKRAEELAKQLDSVSTERMMHDADKKVLKSSRGHAETQLRIAESKLREAEKRAFTATEAVKGHADQMAKERRRVEEADKRVDRMREAVSLLETAAHRTEIKQTELSENARKAHASMKSAEESLEAERRRREALEVDLRVANGRINEERKRAEVEQEAQDHKCQMHAGKGPCPDAFRRPPMEKLEKVVSTFDVKTNYISLSQDNLKTWRDTVLSEINENLTMLYCFQRQVEEQRDSFVQEYTRRASVEEMQELQEDPEEGRLKLDAAKFAVASS